MLRVTARSGTTYSAHARAAPVDHGGRTARDWTAPVRRATTVGRASSAAARATMDALARRTITLHRSPMATASDTQCDLALRTERQIRRGCSDARLREIALRLQSPNIILIATILLFTTHTHLLPDECARREYTRA